MAKFCTNCGAPLKPDSLFCEECGTRVGAAPAPQIHHVEPPAEAVNVVPSFTPAPQAQAPQAPSRYAKTETMSEASEIAISRNKQGRWSYWSSPTKFRNIPWNLQHFAEKEDKRLSQLDDHEGMLYYVVSASGSLGQVYADEMNDGKHVLEWVYFAPGESDDTLPSAPEEL